MTNADDFKIFFNWLKPHCFLFLAKVMETFASQDQAVLTVMKLIVELVNNRSHRYLTFAMKTVNCLVIFKETSSIVMRYFQGPFT
jgi:hypothetical protein